MRPRAYLLLPLLIPLIGVLLAANANAATTSNDTVRGQRTVLIQPAHPTSKVVLYVHGAGETADDALGRPGNARLVARLLPAGYSIATSDARGDNWGTRASVLDYVALARSLRARGLTRVYILATSMGGMDGWQLIDRLHPVAWAGIAPACNLRAEAPISRVAAGIRAAHPSGIPASLSPVRALDVRGLRMMFFASPQDTVVPKALNTDPCSRWAAERGARVRVVSVHGDHGDQSHFQPDRLARFFAGR